MLWEGDGGGNYELARYWQYPTRSFARAFAKAEVEDKPFNYYMLGGYDFGSRKAVSVDYYSDDVISPDLTNLHGTAAALSWMDLFNRLAIPYMPRVELPKTDVNWEVNLTYYKHTTTVNQIVARAPIEDIAIKNIKIYSPNLLQHKNFPVDLYYVGDYSNLGNFGTFPYDFVKLQFTMRCDNCLGIPGLKLPVTTNVLDIGGVFTIDYGICRAKK
ncbi:MAG: hypothetical protein VB100_09090 [Angelakisella sp.]|nr:hypothetical protein [Angelakisella sp.]